MCMRVGGDHEFCLGYAEFVVIVLTYLELTRKTKTSDKGLDILEFGGYRC